MKAGEKGEIYTDRDAFEALAFGVMAMHDALVDGGLIQPGDASRRMRTMNPDRRGLEIMVEHLAKQFEVGHFRRNGPAVIVSND